MALPVPKLDDRNFQDIVDEAKTRLRSLAPAWTDHNVSDPGITLIELFAWMTEMIIYRLNRVPEKQYIAFMRLLGITLDPPGAAQAPITFRLTRPVVAGTPAAEGPFVPAGAEVSTLPTAQRPEVVTFAVDADTHVAHPGAPRIYRQRADDAAVTERQGGDSFPMFGDGQAAPIAGDCLYLGFDRPIAGYTLRLHLAFGQAKPSNYNQKSPPIEWLAWCGERGGPGRWIEARAMLDTTGGLINDGSIDILAPLDMPPDPQIPVGLAGAAPLYYLCCRYTPTSASQSADAADSNQPADARGNVYNRTPTLEQLEVAVSGVTASASHAGRVLDEQLGVSDGTPAQRFQLAFAPVLPFAAGEAIEVETGPGSDVWVPWEPAPDGDFSRSHGRNHVLVDYATGEVCFGPSIREASGAAWQYGNVPPRGARVRASRYRFGGGVAGNVAAETLTVLRRTLPYVEPETCNYWPASGGRDRETIEQAMLRVPREVRVGERAVTPRDFEQLALRADPRVARAHCLEPGAGDRTVRVLVVRQAKSEDLKPISKEDLLVPGELRKQVRAYLDERRMITTRVQVDSPRFVEVAVLARVRLRPGANGQQIQHEALRRLYRFLNPLTGGNLSGESGDGWEFGRALYPSEMLVLLQSIQGVKLIEWLVSTPSIWQLQEQDQRWRLVEAPTATQEPVILAPGDIICSGEHTVLVDVDAK